MYYFNLVKWVRHDETNISINKENQNKKCLISFLYKQNFKSYITIYKLNYSYNKEIIESFIL